jgi:hypothetical protein
MGLAHFSIGTATDRIDLLRNVRIVDWDPSETPLEETWAGTSLSEGRQPVMHRYTNAIEEMTLHIIAPNQDAVIHWSQDLRRMLTKAVRYWDENAKQPNIVYVMARASCETNMRYCWVYAGDVPKDQDPFGPIFAGRKAPRFWERQFIFERGPWMANPPGEGESVAVTASQSYCFPSYLEFDGSGDEVDCHSDAKLDDIPDFAVAGKGDICAEAWIRPTGWGENNEGHIFDKGSWWLAILSIGGLYGFINCAGANAGSTSGLDEFSLTGDWVHVAMVYSEAGHAGMPSAREVYLSVGGVWVGSYTLQTTSAGNYNGDAPQDLRIGNNLAANRCWEGDIGWCRVSDTIRYTPNTGNFTPPDRCILPSIDVNTQGQWIKEGEGAGAGAVANQAGGTAGDLTGAEWDCDCPHTLGYVAPVTPCYDLGARIYNSAPISIPTGVWTVLTYDLERWDTNGFHTLILNNSRLTSYAEETYIITGHVRFEATGANITGGVHILLNGITRIAETVDELPTSGTHSITVSTTYRLEVLDYIELFAYQATGGNRDISAIANWSLEFAIQANETE